MMAHRRHIDHGAFLHLYQRPSSGDYCATEDLFVSDALPTLPISGDALTLPPELLLPPDLLQQSADAALFAQIQMLSSCSPADNTENHAAAAPAVGSGFEPLGDILGAAHQKQQQDERLGSSLPSSPHSTASHHISPRFAPPHHRPSALHPPGDSTAATGCMARGPSSPGFLLISPASRRVSVGRSHQPFASHLGDTANPAAAAAGAAADLAASGGSGDLQQSILLAQAMLTRMCDGGDASLQVGRNSAATLLGGSPASPQGMIPRGKAVADNRVAAAAGAAPDEMGLGDAGASAATRGVSGGAIGGRTSLAAAAPGGAFSAGDEWKPRSRTRFDAEAMERGAIKPRSMKERRRRDKIGEGLRQLRQALPDVLLGPQQDMAAMIEAAVTHIANLQARVNCLEKGILRKKLLREGIPSK